MSETTLKSPAALAQDISRRKENVRCLRGYITTALKLPITAEDTAREFSIDNAVKDKLKEHIESSAKMNRQLQEHCQKFQNTTLKQLTTLIRDVKNYAKKAQTNFPSLCNDLQQLLLAKQTGQSNADELLKSVKGWAELTKSKSAKILKEAEDVTDGLQTFSNQTTKDEGDVGREITYLNEQSNNFGGGSSHLTIAVDTLVKLAAGSKSVAMLSSDEDEQKSVWVPLVGLVPQRVIKDPRGKNHFDVMTKLLKSKDENILLERASLTCRMMTSYWEKIHELLKPARKAVQAIQGSFEQLKADLEYIEENADDLKQFPYQNYITQNKDTWRQLEVHANDFLDGAFNDEIEGL
jgi:hypothetical protein